MKKKLDGDIELKDPKLVGLKINPDMIEERHGQTFSAYSWFYHRKLFVNGIEVDEETQYRHPLYKDVQRWAVIKVNKRLEVIARNISRLESELKQLRDEENKLIAAVIKL